MSELVVRGAGLEPARYFYHEPLKLACLPFHHPRKIRAASRGSAVKPRPQYYYLGGAGSNGLLAGAEPPGAIGIELSGASAGVECTGTGTRRPSKILPLMRLVEEYAKNSEVKPNSRAKVHVSLKSGLLAPPAPNTVWLEPPKTAPTSAPLPCCSNTMIVNAMQTVI